MPARCSPEVLAVPERFVPVWLQLVGYPAESPEAGGQLPRGSLDDLFAMRRWGTPFGRDEGVLQLEEEEEEEGLLQEPAPLPWRFEELNRLSTMFGMPA
jgi:hypothetical protein